MKKTLIALAFMPMFAFATQPTQTQTANGGTVNIPLNVTTGSQSMSQNMSNSGNGTGVAEIVNSNMGNSNVSVPVTATSSSGGNVQSNQGNNAQQAVNVSVGGNNYEAPKLPPSTAFAAPLTASNGACMGSSSAGFQGGVGVSFGTTWKDADCDRRYDAQILIQLGAPKAALELMCQKDSVQKALAEIGYLCGKVEVKLDSPYIH